MMKRNGLIVLGVILVYAAPPVAVAVPSFGDGGVGLQAALDNITVGPNPGISSTNVLTDSLSDITDSYWSIDGAGASVTTMVLEVAQWAELTSFGVYDAANPASRVQLFDGVATSGSLSMLSILADGSVVVNFVDTGIDFSANAFGYYIDSSAGHPGWTGGVWHSDTSLNADGRDHMYAYAGKGVDTIQILPYSPGVWDVDEYVLAFEDLDSMHWGNQNGLNDGYPEWSDMEPDFTDLVVIVESVSPVLAPGAIVLGGIGTVLVGFLRRRRGI